MRRHQLDSAQSAAASSGLKAMIPVGRPFLDYVLSALADAGFQQACLVIGPEHNVVREYYASLQRPTRIAVSFAVQPDALGTANAVLAAEEFAGDDEFLTLNGDNYYPVEALQASYRTSVSRARYCSKPTALVRYSNIPQERIRDFAYCVVDRSGFLADIVEKPERSDGRQFRRRKAGQHELLAIRP